jgi:hypothetical protein
MGIRDAWAALWGGRGEDKESAAKALASTLDIMGAPDAATEAHGILAGVLPYSQPPKRGTLQLMLLYATAPWLRAVVSRISHRVAATEWELDKIVGADGKAIVPKAAQHAMRRELRQKAFARYAKAGATAKPIDDHPMLEFLRHGNSVLDGRTAMQITATHVLLKGEGYWLIERFQDGPMVGLPCAFWPIPPFWVAETATTLRPFYRLAFMGWNVSVPESEIVRFTDPDPFNPLGRGVGLAESLTDELDQDEYAKKWVKGRLYNQGVPRTVVTMEGGGEAEAKRIQEEWRQSFQGVFNQFKTWFTPRKLLVQQLEPKFEEMKLMELRSANRDSVLELFGYPKELLGIVTTQTTRGALDTAEFRLEKYAVEPWREFFRHGMQHRLATAWTDKVVLDYVDEVPANREFQMAAAKVRPYAFTNNKFLEIAGFEPTEEAWGDERPPTPVDAPEDKEVIPGGGGGLGGGKAADPEWARELRALRRKASGDEGDEQDDRDFTHDDIDDVLSAVEDEGLADEELSDILERNVREIGGKAMRELGMQASAFDHRDPRVKKYLEEQSSAAITAIDDTTKADIRTTLAKVADEGGSVRDAGREIRKYFEDASVERSNLIAQTENLRASGYATHEAFTQSGLALKKYWQHGGGEDDPRQGHVDLAAAEPIDLDEPFVNPETGVAMLYPGEAGDPGEDCNCHCSHWVKAAEPKAAKAPPTGAELRAWRKPGEARIRRVAKVAFARQAKAALKALRG